MKKILLLIGIILSLLSGCKKEAMNKKKIVEKEEKETIINKVPEKEENTYITDNNTPICFYELKNNKLVKLTSMNATLNNLEDIGLFQVYPSCEEEISLTKSFADSFKETWDNYNKEKNRKIGYSLNFKTKENNTIFFNILSPETTMEKWEYIMVYLYDDYANKTKPFYSHLENVDFNENTFLTAIKLQSGYKYNEIVDKIEVQVYTYEKSDDFLNNHYRGNSTSTLTINIQ